MKRGFTFIELLVVLAIIALLAGLTISTFTSASARSRDARRESDVKEIQKALAIYANSTGKYPQCSTEVIISGANDCLSDALLLEKAMSAVPTDPRYGVGGGSCGSPGSFYYCYQSDTGDAYNIRYDLETNTISGKTSGWQNAGP